MYHLRPADASLPQAVGSNTSSISFRACHHIENSEIGERHVQDEPDVDLQMLAHDPEVCKCSPLTLFGVHKTLVACESGAWVEDMNAKSCSKSTSSPCHGTTDLPLRSAE